jgi:hypothetical protein
MREHTELYQALLSDVENSAEAISPPCRSKGGVGNRGQETAQFSSARTESFPSGIDSHGKQLFVGTACAQDAMAGGGPDLLCTLLFPAFLHVINSRPVGLFTGGYRRYRASGQAVDLHTERSGLAERCNRVTEEMRRCGGRIATLRREGCNVTDRPVANILIKFNDL